MAYTKNTWNTGDIVSSQKLNHMEDGIADAGGIMVINNTDNTLDKTWQEVYDAISQGSLVMLQDRDTTSPEEYGILTYFVTQVFLEDNEYSVKLASVYGENIVTMGFTANNADDYPTGIV